MNKLVHRFKGLLFSDSSYDYFSCHGCTLIAVLHMCVSCFESMRRRWRPLQWQSLLKIPTVHDILAVNSNGNRNWQLLLNFDWDQFDHSPPHCPDLTSTVSGTNIGNWCISTSFINWNPSPPAPNSVATW